MIKDMFLGAILTVCSLAILRIFVDAIVDFLRSRHNRKELAKITDNLRDEKEKDK